MPTDEELRQFLREHLKFEIFEGRDGELPGWSDSTILRCRIFLERYHYGVCSPAQTRSGKPIYYDKDLTILDGPP